MAKNRCGVEQIIQLLPEVETHKSEGKTMAQALR